jgi:hypothetical protein
MVHIMAMDRVEQMGGQLLTGKDDNATYIYCVVLYCIV